MQKFPRHNLHSQLSHIKKVSIDRQLLILVLALLIFGVIMVGNSSVVDAVRYFDDKFFYVKRQVVWSLIGLVALTVCSKINYNIWKKTSIYLVILSLILLLLVLIPGVGSKVLGAKRWIQIGDLVIQPAEFAKLALFTYFPALLLKKETRIFLILLGIVFGLIMLEPDMGTAAIIAVVSVILYFSNGAPLWHFLSLLPVGAIGFLMIWLSSYRRERLLTFFDPSSDPLGSSYHIRQILIALGSGGLWGVGLGQSRQKYLFLPEPATDSIFAIIGEELGFVGGFIVVFAFLFFIWKGLLIASRAQDMYGKLLAVALTSWIGMQAFVNLSTMVALLPLTGVPLPFVSYGGSALVVNLAAVGILISISKKPG